MADAERPAYAEVAEDLAAEFLLAEHALDFPGTTVCPMDVSRADSGDTGSNISVGRVYLDVDAVVHGGDTACSGEVVATRDGHEDPSCIYEHAFVIQI